MNNKHFNSKIDSIIYKISRYLEILFAVIILLVIIASIFSLIINIFRDSYLIPGHTEFNDFLSNALTLVVGLEFVKMLCQHTSETVLEVLMLATARQMVVEHLNSTQTLIGVAAIAALFATRKYLLLKPEMPANADTPVQKNSSKGVF